MVVALVEGRVRAEEVKIVLAIHIPYVHALPLAQHHRDGRIVVGAKVILPLNVLQSGMRDCSHKLKTTGLY